MGRSVPLRPPAFHGACGEPLQLRLQGLTLPAIPIGVGWPPLHCTVWRRTSDCCLTIHLFIRFGGKKGVPFRYGRPLSMGRAVSRFGCACRVSPCPLFP